ncbi:hypothetical protein [Mariniradius sediminis]|uniref:Leucine rich repeat variant n=1 Tax=Mariniradius sediminis TaxID=2909237 RepID=A0ABS9BTJ7_9BACT|nr:hypothetical protein [Mariniradius sediminis]MCF1750471.1 hypothetical protein [Mariniradius sediminis]
MINSADEFVQLRQSEDINEQRRASNDSADIGVWHEIIQRFPDFKLWVVHNKTIPIEILTLLAKDKDPKIRIEVARKRKISDEIFSFLSEDEDENIRYSLMCNSKLSLDKKQTIKVDDSTWLTAKLEEMIKNAGS